MDTSDPSSFAKIPSSAVYITPENIEVYKHPGKVAADGYRVSKKRNITVINPENVVAYYVSHTFIPTTISVSPVFEVEDWKDSMKVYAIGADGEEIELKRL